MAGDRFGGMVPHTRGLAQESPTRIVNKKDGKTLPDSDKYVIGKEMEPPQHRNMGKASMSFLTALSLSFNNLKTKRRAHC